MITYTVSMKAKSLPGNKMVIEEVVLVPDTYNSTMSIRPGEHVPMEVIRSSAARKIAEYIVDTLNFDERENYSGYKDYVFSLRNCTEKDRKEFNSKIASLTALVVDKKYELQIAKDKNEVYLSEISRLHNLNWFQRIRAVFKGYV